MNADWSWRTRRSLGAPISRHDYPIRLFGRTQFRKRKKMGAICNGFFFFGAERGVGAAQSVSVDFEHLERLETSTVSSSSNSNDDNNNNTPFCP